MPVLPAGAVLKLDELTSISTIAKNLTFTTSGTGVKITATIELTVPNSRLFDSDFSVNDEYPDDKSGENHVYLNFNDHSNFPRQVTNSHLLLAKLDLTDNDPGNVPVTVEFPLKVLSGKTRWGV